MTPLSLNRTADLIARIQGPSQVVSRALVCAPTVRLSTPSVPASNTLRMCTSAGPGRRREPPVLEGRRLSEIELVGEPLKPAISIYIGFPERTPAKNHAPHP